LFITDQKETINKTKKENEEAKYNKSNKLFIQDYLKIKSKK
jgi:hypothetical protein